MDGRMLETERLLLRRFTSDDAPALLAMMSDDEVMRFLPWFTHTCVADTASYLDEQYLTWYRVADAGERGAGGLPLDLRFAVCLRQADGGADELIGFIKISSESDTLDLGYAFCRKAWGHGYATEAVRALIAEARREGFPFLTATHDESNPASGRVMERCGMTYRYAYRERWQPKDFDVVFKMYQIDLAAGVETYRGYWERYPEHWV